MLTWVCRSVVIGLCLGVETRARVNSLPGFGAPPTAHYTGFVTVDAPSNSTLFYYFVESAGAPSIDPVIWWMNGGPGASSLIGLLTENGPLLLAADGLSLFENPYSWNLHANMLFVEFAPGVGFSFCNNSSDPRSSCKQSDGSCSPCLADDNSVAAQNVAFLSRFLTSPNLFPSLKGRPLFLAGESYAGVYLPTLALALLKGFPDTSIVNLSGLWVTDPCTDNKGQFGWIDLGINFAYNMGQISASVFNTLSSAECTSQQSPTGDRTRIVNTQQCRAAWRLYDIATNGIGEQPNAPEIPGLPMYIDPLNVFGLSGGPDPEAYFNRADVRQALTATAANTPNAVYHIALANNGYPQYSLRYAACNAQAQPDLPSMVDVYTALIALSEKPSGNSLRTIIISSGVQDPVVSQPGTEAAVLRLGYPVLTGGDRRPWFYNDTATDGYTLSVKPFAWGPNLHMIEAGVQMGGFVTNFDTGTRVNLAFTTVHRSGHMVPAYAPQSARHVIDKGLLRGQPLCPLLPNNWDNVPDSQFYALNPSHQKTAAPGLFAQWVVQAMGVS